MTKGVHNIDGKAVIDLENKTAISLLRLFTFKNSMS